MDCLSSLYIYNDYIHTANNWRVPLQGEQPDYIHAVFACSYRQKHAFILTQPPMQETYRDFWKMVYERECGAIVMLSGLMEDGQVIIISLNMCVWGGGIIIIIE